MTGSQRTSLDDPVAFNQVHLVDLGLAQTVRDQFQRLLDAEIQPQTPLSYSWSQLRSHLHACHIFLSKSSVVARPYIIPTFDHVPFASASRRVYLSATLGDVEDLKRAYAVERIEAVRAAQKQDGRRFVFVPELSMGPDDAWYALASIWPQLNPQRAVLIAPSFPALDRADLRLLDNIGQLGFAKFDASAVEESLEPFTSANNAVLELANRYDGLDLPDEDCRLLMLSDSPRATNELEANLTSAWKLGPALRWREANRLVQGMGRCTRNATDFAVLILFGESLVNAMTNNSLLQLLPPTLQAEIEWGKTQLRESNLDCGAFAEMVAGLISDKDYRHDAEQSILEQASQMTVIPAPEPIAVANLEVAHAKAYWREDFTRANELAREIADKLSGREWAGFRSWWLYLTSVAARLGGNGAGEVDALKRAKGTGVNAGWLDYAIRCREATAVSVQSTSDDLSGAVSEQIWSTMDELGWSGKRFVDFANRTLADVADTQSHKAFHQGLVSLGTLLGAVSNAPSQQGDPDVIWRFGDNTWVCFEAKSEKLKDGHGIGKRDLLQAKGHVDWVRFFESQGKSSIQVIAVIVAPLDRLQPSAEPHTGDVYFISTSDVADWVASVKTALLELRAKFAGQDFAEAREQFCQHVAHLGLDVQATLGRVKATQLSSGI